MADYDNVAMRFVARRLGKTTKPDLRGNPGPGYRDGRMFASGDSLFSYGTHFELARYIAPTKAHPEGLFLINGDTWGPTTGKQQRATRGAIDRSDAAWVNIPHRALNAAGIDLDSIILIDKSADRWLSWTETKHDLPGDSEWKRVKIVDKRAETGDIDAEGNRWADRFKGGYSLPVSLWRDRGLQFTLFNILVRKDEQRRGKHWGVITPEVWHWSEIGLYSKRSKWDAKSDWNYDAESKTYSRNRSRHLLGESLISAEVVYVVRKKCADCGGFGRRPGPHAWGPIDGGSDGSMWRNHHLCFTCRGEQIVATIKRRRAHFLSGFDANESRPSYFFCELPPKVKPTTVAEAYEVLKPEAVRLAESLGREVKRQGDIFAIPTAYSKRDLTAKGAKFARSAYVLSTNHQATEVAILPDGTTLARGTLKHAPEGRQPDHKRVSIGREFAILQKNTVPTTK